MFFAIRQLYHKLTKSVDHVMPLTPPTNSASCGDLVDLSELVYVTMVMNCLFLLQTTMTCCHAQLL